MPLTAQGAIIKATNKVLRADASLLATARGGVWYRRAGASVACPYVTWRIMSGLREDTIGGEAYRFFVLRVLAVWEDANGENFQIGETMYSRILYAMDGTERADQSRIKTAFDTYLGPAGWSFNTCQAMTEIPADAEPTADDQNNPRWSMGALFHAYFERST